MTWTDLPNRPARHGWAFYYFLKRRGDHVTIVRQAGPDGPLTIHVTPKHKESRT